MNLPPFETYPFISDDKITLRQIQPLDIKDLIEISFYDSILASSLNQAIEMQEKINNDYNSGNSIHWCIIDNLTNKVVGTCGYYRGFENGAGELGCVLLPKYRGQGFMTFAMRLAINYGINNIGLKRIWAITTTENNKAIKLLTKLNFIKNADLQDNEIEYEYLANVD